MVELETDNTAPGCARLILSPNNALSWRASLWIIACLAIISLGTSILMFTLGATLVLLYSVIEISFFAYLSYRISRRCGSLEIIELSPDAVTIERGYRRLEFRCCMERMATRVEVDRDGWKAMQLFFVCRQTRLAVGTELNQQEREHLLEQLRSLIAKYQNRFVVPLSAIDH